MARISGKTGNVYIASGLIDDGEDAWNEQVIGSVTASADSTSGNYKVGSASAKFVVDVAFTTGLIGSEVVTSMNLSAYSQLMAWVKSSVALSASDWNIKLDDSALCGTPIVTANIPALLADTWKLIKVTADLSGCTAIISVGLGQAVDKGAMNFWIDDLRAAKAIAGIKSWALDYAMDTIDVTAFDSGGHRQFFPVLDTWSGSFEGFKEGAPLTIGTMLSAEFQESSTSTQVWRGEIIITGISPAVTVDGVVTYGYTFTGTDLLEIPTA